MSLITVEVEHLWPNPLKKFLLQPVRTQASWPATCLPPCHSDTLVLYTITLLDILALCDGDIVSLWPGFVVCHFTAVCHHLFTSIYSANTNLSLPILEKNSANISNSCWFLSKKLQSISVTVLLLSWSQSTELVFYSSSFVLLVTADLVSHLFR